MSSFSSPIHRGGFPSFVSVKFYSPYIVPRPMVLPFSFLSSPTSPCPWSSYRKKGHVWKGVISFTVRSEYSSTTSGTPRTPVPPFLVDEG